MRHISTRSAIWVVIGVGLFILTMSQLRRGDEASNATFVANTSPFESLKDYRPSAPLADVQPHKDNRFQSQLVSEAPVFEPMAAPSMAAPSMDSAAAISMNDVAAQVPSALPVDLPQENIETGLEVAANGLEAAADFVNTANPVQLPEPGVPSDGPESHYDLGFEDSPEVLPALDEETAALDSPKVAIIEPLEIQQDAPAVADRASTALPAVNNSGAHTQKRIINNRIASPGSGVENTGRRSPTWKKNPFLTDAPLNEASTESPSADAFTADIIPPQVGSLILPEFATATEDLSVIGDFEDMSTSQAQQMLPAVDHETMLSVVPEHENFEAGSPPIQVSLSESDAQKAVHNIEYGKSLSRRGASYAARQEFFAALRILAQSNDQQVGGTAYTQALRNGIIAIKEAQDFIVTDTEAQIGLSVAHVIETHSTNIISAASAEGMTPIEAAQRYFAYASHHLSRCGGQNVVAAEALYCLGKLHSVQAKSASNDSKLDLAKAMIYHQAAISASGSNFRSLNELGVLYANSGRFDEAKHMLKQSLRIKALPQAWQNLSVIHQRMGEHQLAQLANREFELTSSQAPSSVIRWTPVEEFNKNAPLPQHNVSQASANLPIPETTRPAPSGIRSLGGRILNSIR